MQRVGVHGEGQPVLGEGVVPGRRQVGRHVGHPGGDVDRLGEGDRLPPARRPLGELGPREQVAGVGPQRPGAAAGGARALVVPDPGDAAVDVRGEPDPSWIGRDVVVVVASVGVVPSQMLHGHACGEASASTTGAVSVAAGATAGTERMPSATASAHATAARTRLEGLGMRSPVGASPPDGAVWDTRDEVCRQARQGPRPRAGVWRIPRNPRTRWRCGNIRLRPDGSGWCPGASVGSATDQTAPVGPR